MVKLTRFLNDPTVTGSGVTAEVPDTDVTTQPDGSRKLENGQVSVTAGTTFQAQRWNPDTFRPASFDAVGLPYKNVELTTPDSGVFPTAVGDVFPVFSRDEVSPGRAQLDANGKQTWTVKDNGAVQTNVFVALNQTYQAATKFAGRPLGWGVDGKLAANTDRFQGFNAYYSPSTKSLNFGDELYFDAQAQRRVMRLAASSDVVSHEAGHALHDVLKPNQVDWLSPVPFSFGQWGESFGDQTAMWTSLQDPQFCQQLIASYGTEPFNLTKSNPLSKIGEFATEIYGAPIRDAVNGYQVEDTSEEVHARSEVLTGAVYDVFAREYDRQVNEVMRKNGHIDVSTRATVEEKTAALQAAGAVMGQLLFRSTDHSPEDFTSMKDVARAMLTADEVHLGGRLGSELAAEFLKRKLLTPADVSAWKRARQHVAVLQAPANGADLNAFVAQRVDALIPGAKAHGFGLKVQGTYRDEEGRLFLRTQLTHTVGSGSHADHAARRTSRRIGPRVRAMAESQRSLSASARRESRA